jgi:RNA polymerase sigma factor (sigma-70 family)
VTPQPLEPVLDYARRLGAAASDDAPDGELLRRFGRNNDAVAFEQLLRRHGPMVRGVCRRVLRDGNDVDDAFQATFLLLVRKAGGLRKPERLGPWLHGVALRTALKARERTAGRRECRIPVEPAASPTSEGSDWREALDAAIARLPARERTAVVMCYLDGVTYADAAQRLCCPLGTLAARLSRARDRLRARLTRDGLAPSAEVLPLALAGESLPPALAVATVRGAIALRAGAAAGVVPTSVLALMEGVHRTMLMQTWKVALAVLALLGVTGGGVGVFVARTAGAGQAAKSPEQPQGPRAGTSTLAQPTDRPREQATPLPLVLLRQEPPKVYLIEPGDFLGIYVEGVLGEKDKPPPVTIPQATVLGQTIPQPSIGYPILVQQDGTISLPLLEPLVVRGKSQQQVEDMIKKRYVEENILVRGKERVLASIARPRTYRVTVARRDVPGTAPSHYASVSLELPAYENDVLNALARSGGLPAPEAEATVIVQRDRTPTAEDPGRTQEVRIPLHTRPSQAMPHAADMILQNGDVIIVESRPVDQKSAAVADSAPQLTFAVAAPDGRILVQLPGAGGPGPWQLFDSVKITANESDGKAIDAKTLGERLRTMTTVLVATDGRATTAAHLQAVKPGTIVLTVQAAN